MSHELCSIRYNGSRKEIKKAPARGLFFVTNLFVILYLWKFMAKPFVVTILAVNGAESDSCGHNHLVSVCIQRSSRQDHTPLGGGY